MLIRLVYFFTIHKTRKNGKLQHLGVKYFVIEMIAFIEEIMLRTLTLVLTYVVYKLSFLNYHNN